MIEFKEHSSPNYTGRTIENASADITIAFAIDFNTAGEKLTAKAVKDHGKTLLKIDATSLLVTQERVERVVNKLNSVKAKSINIAGNGIYTLKKLYTQKQLNDFMTEFIYEVLNHKDLKCKIELIRSGGQTGFDEAGIMAADKLGITTLVLAPKGWRFRDINGKDVYNENLFKLRFL